MPKNTPPRPHQAILKVTFDLMVPVVGKTLEEAIVSARLLKTDDFIDFIAGVEVNDCDVVVSGVMTA